MSILREFRDLPSYFHLLKAAVESRMEYRGSFFMFVFTVIGFYAAQIAVIALMLNRFKHIGGWSPGEIAFLYGLLVMAQGIVSVFFSGLLNFSTFVREGTFDRVLLRPLSSLGQIVSMGFDPAGLAHFIFGLAAFITANSMIDIQWTFYSTFFFICTIFGGAMILGAVRIIIAGIAFFTVSNQGLQHLVVFSSREFLLYPVDIYIKPVRFLLTFLLPIAFINFYPAHFFLDKSVAGGLPLWFPYMTLPIGLGIFIMAVFVWKFCVKHYASTGS